MLGRPDRDEQLTILSWDKKLFPDHVAFLRGLHDRNLKVTLNTHPADGIRGYEDCYKAMCKAMGVDPATDYVRNPSHPCSTLTWADS